MLREEEELNSPNHGNSLESGSGRSTMMRRSRNADELRNITDNFDDLLKQATKEIKNLTGEKRASQLKYKNLMSINEELAGDLSAAIAREKEVTEERDSVIKANEELYSEAQRLTDEEANWNSVQKELRENIEKLKRENAILANKLDCLEEETGELKGFKEDNVKLSDELDGVQGEKNEMEEIIINLKRENDVLRDRKEMAAGENLQLMFEVDNTSKQFKSLKEDLDASHQRIKLLEKENRELNSRLKVVEANKADKLLYDKAVERTAELESKNRDLLEWRNQLSEKNKNLNAENQKLRSKCANLEDLLNEESADINEVLELIKNLQTQASNHNCANPNTSPLMAPIAKFRDFNKINPR